MNRINKILSIILCFILFCTSFPVYAEEGRFISFTVETINADGKINSNEEVGYADGDTIYVPIEFFTKYTMYYYNSDTTTFVRGGQPEKSFYGQVKLNVSQKTITVYPVSTECQEYDLYDCYMFGNQWFLPLDQMCAVLKALIKIDGTKMRILNSGYSLADAEYALSMISGKNGYLNFGVNHIIDDIFFGNEVLFKASALKNYFSSTIFGLRLDNLLIFSDIGNGDEYRDFLERCITDNENYIKTMTTNDDLIQRVNDAHSAVSSVKDTSDTFENVTSIIKDLSDPLQGEGLEEALLYVNANDWNELFETISTVAECAEYYLKLGSMCEDNENLLVNFEDYYLKSTGILTNDTDYINHTSSYSSTFYLASHDIRNKYSGSLARNITAQVGGILAEKIVQNGKKVILEKVLPSTSAISLVADVCKLLGYDLTANTEYSVMVNFDVKSKINNYYFDMDNSNFVERKDGTEEYRLSAILMLLAMKQCYISSNNLSESVTEGYLEYKDEIEKVNSILDLFYAAAQSKDFDSFEGIYNIMEKNSSEISESNLVSNAESATQEDSTDSSSYLEATKKEIDEIDDFIKMIFGVDGFDSFKTYYKSERKSDCNTFSYEFFINELLNHASGDSYIYAHYFDNVESIYYKDKADPLKKFKPLDDEETGYYVKYSKKNVDWIATNIMNISSSSINNADLDEYKEESQYFDQYYRCYRYYHSGYFYHEISSGYGDAGRFFEMVDYTRLNDGRYSVTLKEQYGEYEEDYGDATTIKTTVALKKINGKRYWTLCSIDVQKASPVISSPDSNIEQATSSHIPFLSFTGEFEIETSDNQYSYITKTYSIPQIDVFNYFSFDGYSLDYLTYFKEQTYYVVDGEYEHEYDGIVNLLLIYSDSDFSKDSFIYGEISVDTDSFSRSVIVDSSGKILHTEFGIGSSYEDMHQELLSGYFYDADIRTFKDANGKVITEDEFEQEKERILSGYYAYV